MKWLMALIGPIMGAIISFFAGKSVGKSKEQAKNATKAYNQARRANEIDSSVRGTDANKRLRDKYQRD